MVISKIIIILIITITTTKAESEQIQSLNYICEDSNCITCGSKYKHSCIQCDINYILFLGECGLQENCTIKNCEICLDEKKCLKCKSCITSTGKCSCIERIIIYIFCALLSFFIIGVVLYCLMHPVKSSLDLNKDFNIIIRRNLNNHNIHVNNINDNFMLKNLSDEFLINEFEKNKIIINEDNIENKKCDNCLVNITNVKLNCNCFICFDCLKKEELNKKCPKCKKGINNIQQITCGICFGNKKEISKFKCGCSLVVCFECYIKWRKENNFCPACRNLI